MTSAKVISECRLATANSSYMATAKVITIYIAEDHTIARLGLKMLLEQIGACQVVGETDNGETAVNDILEIQPQVVVMGLDLPKLSGIDAARQVKARSPNIRILAFTSAEDDKSITDAVQAGFDGYCLKSVTEQSMVEAIESALDGKPWFDPAIRDRAAKALTKPAKGGLNPGDFVGEFTIEKLLGTGSMGKVYRARNPHIEKVVAIKTLHDHLINDAVTLERFKLEARATSSIDHPNIATIYDFGLLNNKIPYIVMEYLEGKGLEVILKEQGKLDEKPATEIFLQVCQALSNVHSLGIIHRDLKPSNIMLTRKDGNENFVKLVDFGIVKVLQESALANTLTQVGEAIGSPPYMSPEQCEGDKIDLRTDIYALGCTMFETYTGEKPFVGSSAFETLSMHVNDDPSDEPFRKLETPVSRHVEDLIFQMLKKNPKNRPESADVVYQTLLGD